MSWLSTTHSFNLLRYNLASKKGHNTTHCSLTVRSVIEHFTKKGSKVFAAALDASKAYDRVDYNKILLRLLDKGIPPSVVRLLLTWYEATQIRVLFEGNISSQTFGINHSVRQGGILSCALFTSCVMDDLLAELEIAGIGCKVNFRWFGAVAYCDDIILLCPTISGLNKMLNICYSWSRLNHIEFNTKKSFVICFAGEKRKLWPNGNPIPIYMNNNLIPTCHTLTHLGHILSEDVSDSYELEKIAKSFNRQFNAFFARFGSLKNVELQKQLYNTFCTSFYGIEGINLQKVSSSALRFWRKSINLALMKLLTLPPESVSPFLVAEGIMNADSVWAYRALTFWKRVFESSISTRDLLLTTHQNTISTLLNQFQIDTSLKNISKNKLKDSIVVEWSRRKGLLVEQ